MAAAETSSVNGQLRENGEENAVKKVSLLNPNVSKSFDNPAPGVVEEEPDPMEKVYVPDWNNRPPEFPPVLSLNGVGILTWQNLSAIIAAQGMGKSSFCEAILAAFLNPLCDALGITVDKDIKAILYLDFERTNTDVWNSFYRVAKRAGIENGTDITSVTLAGMRSIPRLEERKAAIIAMLEEKEYTLLVMDGAGDLVTDSNDLLQAIECRIWIRELTVKYGLSIFTTLHPNPNSLKPRGHIGSEIMREAEAVMAIQKQGELRIIYSEFEHGKNRNGSPIWGAYQWDDEKMMHCTEEVPAHLLDGKASKRKNQLTPSEFGEDFHHDLLIKVFSKQAIQKSGEFHNNLISVWDNENNDNMSKSRAETFRSHYVLNDFINATKGKGNATFNELADKYLYPRELINDF